MNKKYRSIFAFTGALIGVIVGIILYALGMAQHPVDSAGVIPLAILFGYTPVLAILLGFFGGILGKKKDFGKGYVGPELILVIILGFISIFWTLLALALMIPLF